MRVITKSIFRTIVALYFTFWVVGIGIAINDDLYQVSQSISSTSRFLYQAASIIGICLFFMSVVSMFFFLRYGRLLFCTYISYLVVYTLVYGSGHGGNLLSVVSNIQTMLAGAILTALFLSDYWGPNR